MTKRTNKVKRTSIVMPIDVYKRGLELAERDRRTFNNYVVVLLERAVAGQAIVTSSTTATNEVTA